LHAGGGVKRKAGWRPAAGAVREAPIVGLRLDGLLEVWLRKATAQKSFQ
jgi:hypothetical protein